jgi:hypothetical protein
VQSPGIEQAPHPRSMRAHVWASNIQYTDSCYASLSGARAAATWPQGSFEVDGHMHHDSTLACAISVYYKCPGGGFTSTQTQRAPSPSQKFIRKKENGRYVNHVNPCCPRRKACRDLISHS